MECGVLTEGYDELYREEQLKKVRLFMPYIKYSPKDILLDVGCGTGISSELFNCRKIGLEPRGELIKKTNMPVIQSSAESIPFDDESFDIVISITAIHNFNNIEKGLGEIERVGKNLFVFSVFNKSEKKDFTEKAIRKLFKVGKVLNDEKDTIYICTKNGKETNKGFSEGPEGKPEPRQL